MTNKTMKEKMSGFTWRTFLIMLYMVFVITPCVVYANLAFGGLDATYLAYGLLLVAIVIARYTGNPLTIQEVATIFVATNSLNVGYAINVIYGAYAAQFPALKIFGLEGKLPYWAGFPLPEAGFYTSRSFFHPQFLPSWFSILGFLMPGAATIAGFSLGILNKVLFVDEEKLPYPGVQVTVDFCTTLTKRDPSKMEVFSIVSVLAFIYTLLNIVAPGGFVLWFDLSRDIQRFLPGAIFGFATQLPVMLPAFYLPLHVIISMVIGSIGIWVIGNWWVVSHGLTEFSKMYRFGMKIADVMTWSRLYVWMMPIIGFSLFVGFSNLRPSTVKEAYRILRRAGRAGSAASERLFSIWLVIIPFVIVLLGNLLSIWYWAPDYPMWPWYPMLYTILLSIPSSLLAGRAAGTGISASIPAGQLDRVVLAAAGYKGLNAWFMSPAIVTEASFGGPVASNWVLAERTNSTFTGFLKSFFVIYPISTIASIVFTQMFWSIAPIPSGTYPYSNYFWQIDLMSNLVWFSRKAEMFRFDWMIMGVIVGLVIYIVLSFLHLPAPGIMVALAAGMSSPPPFVMNILFGYFIRLIIEKVVGKSIFDNYKFTTIAAINTGTGLAFALDTAAKLIQFGVFTAPY